mgnify:FL=1|tara:strand:+ start:344 stop:664 length:321 start_codon:yes stop_codon:yes gene_type:complete
MRQIEAKMNKAMRHFLPFSSGNTTVVQHRNEMEVFLHGNHIATLNKISMDLRLFDGGWQSNTTKSRLNALLDEFVPSMGVFQKDFVWYVSDRLDGSVRPFFSGMTV